ncbi:hypothetical protein LIER_30325 [Lithospermum erythrorhizon]|uniref:Uncharacterized protein n=1 Tax=Lithospermum erythrorhizon TaxID=34254 RepID=A0AAV3RP48_LITER
MASRPASPEYTPSFPSYRFLLLFPTCTTSWHGVLCREGEGDLQVVSEADYRKAFHLPILEEELHEAETRIVDVRDHLAKTVLQLARDEASLRALDNASAPVADIEVTHRLIVWDKAMERWSPLLLHEETDEARFIFRAIRYCEGMDSAIDAFLNGLELVCGALQDMVPEHLPLLSFLLFHVFCYSRMLFVFFVSPLLQMDV